MKVLLISLAASGALLSASAEAARVRFQGSLTFLSQSAACTAEDVQEVGSFWIVRFRPPVVPDNGPGTAFSIFHQKNAFSFVLPDGVFNTVFKPVEVMDIGDNFQPWQGVKVRFTTNPVVNAATRFITVNGQISRWENIPGCTLTFTMALVRRPE
jgi:hypothetical protein